MGKLYLFLPIREITTKREDFPFFLLRCRGPISWNGPSAATSTAPTSIRHCSRLLSLSNSSTTDCARSKIVPFTRPTPADTTRRDQTVLSRVRRPWSVDTVLVAVAYSIKVSAGALVHSFDGGRGPFKKIDSVNCKHIGRDVTRASVKTTSAVRMARRLVTTCNQQFGHSASFNANTTVE